MKEEGAQDKGKYTIEEAAKAYFDCNDSESLCRLIEAAAGMIRHFASTYSGGRNNPDLMQAGFEGLLKAVKNFSPDKGAGFATYAGHCIMGEMRHHIRKEARYYKPGCITDLRNKAEKVIEKYYAEHGELPSEGYLAEQLNVKEEGIQQVMKAGLVSLDELELDKISSIRYESFKFPIEDRILLQQSMHKLSDITRKVLYLLFFRDYTQEQTAQKLGLNQRKVSRIMQRGIGDLREAMAVNDDNNKFL